MESTLEGFCFSSLQITRMMERPREEMELPSLAWVWEDDWKMDTSKNSTLCDLMFSCARTNIPAWAGQIW